MKTLFQALCLVLSVAFAVSAAVYFSHAVGHALAPIEQAIAAPGDH